MASVDDYYLMVLVQETLNSRLRRPCDVAPEPSAFTGPPEGIALAVLLGKHQQDLRGQDKVDAWVRQWGRTGCSRGNKSRPSVKADWPNYGSTLTRNILTLCLGHWIEVKAQCPGFIYSL